jgi:GT2 family glycosyltransferase
VTAATGLAPTSAACTATGATRLSACLLILNYNGLEHLEACLSSAVAAAAEYGDARCRVVLVDNRSTDTSVAFTRERFPGVEVVISPVNDFLFSLNAVAAARGEDVAIVLNNDMRFEKDFVAPLVGRFSDPEVFAVGARILDWEGATDTVGPRCARIRACWFHKWWMLDDQHAALSLEACGGAAAYRRTMFVELGGFDPLYRPGYYEDLDLSYRAWARGWKVVYEPGSRVYHKTSASMLARYGDSGKARLLYRNHLLFTVKNIGGAAFLLGFLLLLPLRAVRPLLIGYRVPFFGFLRALPALPLALRRRFSIDRAGVNLHDFERVRALP